MSYVIKKSDGTTLLTLGEGLVDASSSSLTFVGKNVSNFGLVQNENFLYLLENFASDIEPANKMRGQIWYDTNTRSLNFYNGGEWISVGSMTVSSDQPVASTDGYFWFNPTTKKLYINSGSDFLFVGPENTEGYGDTRLISDVLTDTYSNKHPVLKASVGDEVVVIISSDSFLSTDGIDGFTQIKRGINLKNVDVTDFDVIINGKSRYAIISDVAKDIAGGQAGNLLYQDGTTSTAFLTLGNDNTILFSNGTAPTWKSLSEISVNQSSLSSNLTGGLGGSIPFQQANNSTSMLPIGNRDQVLTVGNTYTPTWKSTSSMHVGYATTATYTLNAGGATTAVTQAITDSSTKIATTNFVHSILPHGAIIMWSGDSSDIPQGWHLCDGGNGTPNLTNKFIIGAGETYGANTTGGASTASITVAAAGIHDHGGKTADHTLLESEIPEHGHLVDDIRWSEVGGTYSYNDPMLGPISTGPGTGSNKGSDNDNGVFFLTHGTYKTGGTGPHSHNLSSAGLHTHLVDTVSFLPPYYALCYIMKIV